MWLDGFFIGNRGPAGPAGPAGQASVATLINNDSGSPSVSTGYGVATVENLDVGVTKCTFTASLFADALYQPQVTAEDLGLVNGYVLGAWISDRTSTYITISTTATLSGSAPVLADSVGFTLTILPKAPP